MTCPNGASVINFEVAYGVHEIFDRMAKLPFSVFFQINAKIGISALYKDFLPVNNAFSDTHSSFNGRVNNVGVPIYNFKSFFIVSAKMLTINSCHIPNLPFDFWLKPNIGNDPFLVVVQCGIQTLISADI